MQVDLGDPDVQGFERASGIRTILQKMQGRVEERTTLLTKINKYPKIGFKILNRWEEENKEADRLSDPDKERLFSKIQKEVEEEEKKKKAEAQKEYIKRIQPFRGTPGYTPGYQGTVSGFQKKKKKLLCGSYGFGAERFTVFT